MSGVIELNEMSEVKSFQADWNRLLALTPGGNFFQSLDWLEVYWKHFQADQKLRVLVVRDSEVITGIVPLCEQTMETRYGDCRILTYPFDDWGSFYGPVSANPEATLTEALNYIKQPPLPLREWDLLDLRCVDSDGFDGGATEKAFVTENIEFNKTSWNQTAYVDLNQNWDDYLAGRSGKARQTYLRAERRVAKEGEIEFLRYRPRGADYGEGDPRWDLYEICEAIARKSWQGDSTTGTTLSHEDVAQYFRDTHESAARSGALDLNILYVGGQPAAFNYNYIYQGLVYSLRMGFDPGITNKGLGRLLMGRMLRDSMERGDLIYDIGPGSLDAKKYWYTSVESSYRYVHYSSASGMAKILQLSNQVSNWYRDRFRSKEKGSQKQDSAKQTLVKK